MVSHILHLGDPPLLIVSFDDSPVILSCSNGPKVGALSPPVDGASLRGPIIGSDAPDRDDPKNESKDTTPSKALRQSTSFWVLDDRP